MVPYRTKWKRHHDSEYGFDLKIAQDNGLICWQTLSNAIVSTWNKKSGQNSELGLGNLMRIRQNLYLVSTNDTRAQAETHIDESRKKWISHALRSVLNHPDKGNLVEGIAKQLQ